MAETLQANLKTNDENAPQMYESMESNAEKSKIGFRQAHWSGLQGESRIFTIMSRFYNDSKLQDSP